MCVPTWFRVKTVTIEPGQERDYDAREWHDALVIVRDGRVELEGLSGDHGTFAAGDMLCLAGLPLRALRNPGTEPAALLAISRR